LLSFVFAQGVAHADEGYKALRRSQRPGVSLAGFQVTFIGRFWVTAEVNVSAMALALCNVMLWVVFTMKHVLIC
jgi:hypothetical protein